jgi:hypothetical protein
MLILFSLFFFLFWLYLSIFGFFFKRAHDRYYFDSEGGDPNSSSSNKSSNNNSNHNNGNSNPNSNISYNSNKNSDISNSRSTNDRRRLRNDNINDTSPNDQSAHSNSPPISRAIIHGSFVLQFVFTQEGSSSFFSGEAAAKLFTLEGPMELWTLKVIVEAHQGRVYVLPAASMAPSDDDNANFIETRGGVDSNARGGDGGNVGVSLMVLVVELPMSRAVDAAELSRSAHLYNSLRPALRSVHAELPALEMPNNSFNYGVQGHDHAPGRDNVRGDSAVQDSPLRQPMVVMKPLHEASEVILPSFSGDGQDIAQLSDVYGADYGIAGGAGSLNGDNGVHRVRFRESALEDTF